MIQKIKYGRFTNPLRVVGPEEWAATIQRQMICFIRLGKWPLILLRSQALKI